MRTSPRTVTAITVLTFLAVGGATTVAGAAPAAPADACRDQPRQKPYTLHANSANLHSQPSQSAPVLGVVYQGHRIKVTEERRGWVRVIDKTTGVTGWVSSRLIYRDIAMRLD